MNNSPLNMRLSRILRNSTKAIQRVINNDFGIINEDKYIIRHYIYLFIYLLRYRLEHNFAKLSCIIYLDSCF
uniref:Uncharacterized protein n=1 Tax=Heterorhabditis bacteriophora TaxID=37862 RepID=A0A1I7WMD9_HETBA